MKNHKPILCFDFDGVIHSYTSGWKGATNIPDPPVEGALAYLLEALTDGWDVTIHSSRCRYLFGPRAIRKWLKKHAQGIWHDSPAGPGLERIRIVRMKPSATFTLDDRAMTFTGTWPKLDNLRTFIPWNKRKSRTMEQRLAENMAALQATRDAQAEQRERQAREGWTPSRFA